MKENGPSALPLAPGVDVQYEYPMTETRLFF